MQRPCGTDHCTASLPQSNLPVMDPQCHAGPSNYYEIHSFHERSPFEAINEPIHHPDSPLQLEEGNLHTSKTKSSTVDPSSPPPEELTGPYIPWFWNEKNIGVLPRALLPWLSMLFVMSALYGPGAYFLPWEVGYGTPVYAVEYPLVLLASGLSWLPLLCIFIVRRAFANRTKLVIWFTMIGIISFILTAGGYCALVFGNNASYQSKAFSGGILSHEVPLGLKLRAWSTGEMPRCLPSCKMRLATQQSTLFSDGIYDTQFARTLTRIKNHNETEERLLLFSAFDFEPFRGVQNNHMLCDTGFNGNGDIYGLGMRFGLYLQWISALVANNFLGTTRGDIRKVYLVFSVALCIVTLVSSFTKDCVFSIEIEVLYWMYWGGFVSVFASSLSPVRLGRVTQWVDVDWTTIIFFITHWIMSYHGIWFVCYAYDQVFPRMPCGTYHFFLAPMLDPSTGYWLIRDWLSMMAVPIFYFIIHGFPLVLLLSLPEIKYAMTRSSIYQDLFGKSDASDDDQIEPTKHSSSKLLSFFQFIYNEIKEVQGDIRRICSLPSKRRNGIQLITPLDIKNRRQVIS